MKHLYVYIKDFLTINQCQDIIETYHKNDKNLFLDSPTFWKHCSTKILSPQHLGSYASMIEDKVACVNQDVFGFDLFTKQYNLFHLNTYEGKDNHNYDLHIDAVTGSPKDMKLTVIINLTQGDYTGGEFTFPPLGYEGSIQEFDRSTGCMLVFPSFIAHKVNSVTSGKRTTLVTWFEGPNWK